MTLSQSSADLSRSMIKTDIATRQKRILDLVRDRGFVSVTNLATVLQVSEQTARRDLMSLAQQGLVSKVHGGAGLPQVTADVNYDLRRQRLPEEKARIAREVANYIPEGATVFIDIGTTMEAVAEALLEHKKLTIITNHISVALILSRRSDFDVMLAGGILRRKDNATTGEAAREFIEQFRVGYGIFGIGGVSPDGDLLDYDFRDIGVSRAAMRISKRRLFALDHSKFEADAAVRIGNISNADAIFTDRKPPRGVVAKMRNQGVDLIIA
ncbi:MAG: DeoR/GlpR family DNA-binding transcription regulator [Hyphomicrobiaceae bacterium]